MTSTRLLCLSLGLLAATAAGCGDAITPETTPVSATPDTVIKPEAPAESAPAPAPADSPQPAEGIPEAQAAPASPSVTPIDLAAASPTEIFASDTAAAEAPTPTPAATESVDSIALQKQTFAQFQKALANPDVKYTVVDVWATTCGPCKENFPHLVSMAKTYGEKGLACVSLSLDDREDSRALAAALEFLKSKGATFTNILLDEEFGAGYEQLGVNAIPAVFVYGPDGKEVKRYTLDDPDNQFTYEQVERDIKALLEGKPLPTDQPSTVDASK